VKPTTRLETFRELTDWRGTFKTRAQGRCVADQLPPKTVKGRGAAGSDRRPGLHGFPQPRTGPSCARRSNDNGEIKQRTKLIGLFSAITRLVGAILLEQNDEWAVQRDRYMTL
jgi:putative transposase